MYLSYPQKGITAINDFFSFGAERKLTTALYEKTRAFDSFVQMLVMSVKQLQLSSVFLLFTLQPPCLFHPVFLIADDAFKL